MNRLQLALFIIALLAGGGAFMLMKSRPTPQVVAPVAAPPPPATEQVLVATRDLSFGTQIGDADMAWADWPKQMITGDALLHSAAPNARDEMKTAYVRAPIAKGEPIRRDRLAKGGLMSTMLTPGHRAVAIDVTLSNTAGGFILPNDRVDVMRTYRNSESTQEAGHDVFSTEVVLPNIRVLAIGSTTEKKGSESTVTGSTATLELTPHQTEIVLMAQKSGQLSLALRAISDVRKPDAKADAEEDQQDSADVTIVRRGVVSTLRAR